MISQWNILELNLKKKFDKMTNVCKKRLFSYRNFDYFEFFKNSKKLRFWVDVTLYQSEVYEEDVMTILNKSAQ